MRLGVREEAEDRRNDRKGMWEDHVEDGSESYLPITHKLLVSLLLTVLQESRFGSTA
jgi:hypothetical protein